MHERSVEEGMAGGIQGLLTRRAYHWPNCQPNRYSRAMIGDVDQQDIEELLQVSGESLANDDLRELAEQGIHVELENSDCENAERKEFATDFLSTSLETITEGSRFRKECKSKMRRFG